MKLYIIFYILKNFCLLTYTEQCIINIKTEQNMTREISPFKDGARFYTGTGRSKVERTVIGEPIITSISITGNRSTCVVVKISSKIAGNEIPAKALLASLETLRAQGKIEFIKS